MDVATARRRCVRHVEEGFQTIEDTLESMQLAAFLEVRSNVVYIFFRLMIYFLND